VLICENQWRNEGVTNYLFSLQEIKLCIMLEIFIPVLAKLFSVVNPVGAVPMYLTMTANYTEAERKKTALRTTLYFVGILLAFFWGGSAILGFFGLQINALRIAGGLIILQSGFALGNDKFDENRAMSADVQHEALEKPDITFSPLAMPLLSGPGSISLLIGFFADYDQLNQRLLITGVILLTGLLVYLVLRSAPFFLRFLGVAGLKAGSRIMAFITMAIGVQFIITGVVALVKSMG
jgi:multiple antibiotic resistance protein